MTKRIQNKNNSFSISPLFILHIVFLLPIIRPALSKLNSPRQYGYDIVENIEFLGSALVIFYFSSRICKFLYKLHNISMKFIFTKKVKKSLELLNLGIGLDYFAELKRKRGLNQSRISIKKISMISIQPKTQIYKSTDHRYDKLRPKNSFGPPCSPDLLSNSGAHFQISFNAQNSDPRSPRFKDPANSYDNIKEPVFSLAEARLENLPIKKTPSFLDDDIEQARAEILQELNKEELLAYFPGMELSPHLQVPVPTKNYDIPSINQISSVKFMTGEQDVSQVDELEKLKENQSERDRIYRYELKRMSFSFHKDPDLSKSSSKILTGRLGGAIYEDLIDVKEISRIVKKPNLRSLRNQLSKPKSEQNIPITHFGARVKSDKNNQILNKMLLKTITSKSWEQGKDSNDDESDSINEKSDEFAYAGSEEEKSDETDREYKEGETPSNRKRIIEPEPEIDLFLEDLNMDEEIGEESSSKLEKANCLDSNKIEIKINSSAIKAPIYQKSKEKIFRTQSLSEMPKKDISFQGRRSVSFRRGFNRNFWVNSGRNSEYVDLFGVKFWKLNFRKVFNKRKIERKDNQNYKRNIKEVCSRDYIFNYERGFKNPYSKISIGKFTQIIFPLKFFYCVLEAEFLISIIGLFFLEVVVTSLGNLQILVSVAFFINLLVEKFPMNYFSFKFDLYNFRWMKWFYLFQNLMTLSIILLEASSKLLTNRYNYNREEIDKFLISAFLLVISTIIVESFHKFFIVSKNRFGLGGSFKRGSC